MNLPIELKRELRLFAIDHDTTMSEIAILALKSYLNNDKKAEENEISEKALFEGGE